MTLLQSLTRRAATEAVTLLESAACWVGERAGVEERSELAAARETIERQDRTALSLATDRGRLWSELQFARSHSRAWKALAKRMREAVHVLHDELDPIRCLLAETTADRDSLRAEVEGDNGLRAAKDAGWAIVKALRQELATARQERDRLRSETPLGPVFQELAKRLQVEDGDRPAAVIRRVTEMQHELETVRAERDFLATTPIGQKMKAAPEPREENDG